MATARYFTEATLRGMPVALKHGGYPADVAARQLHCLERAAPTRITSLYMALLSKHFSADERQQLDAFINSSAGAKFRRIAEVTFLRKYGETTDEVPAYTAEEQAAFEAFLSSPAGRKFASAEVQGAAQPGTEIDQKVGQVMRECQAAALTGGRESGAVNSAH